ncbi:hypothetical protein AB4Y40_34210 [Paraburkholderia sp. EG287B]|uniref:hypothetical protein n=1 Tax=Paraburkholderia sp. EG287B TaxID=3237010 RepID=UPI0034D2713C
MKTRTQIIVDRRPIGVRAPWAAILGPGATNGLDAHLTPSEREALEKAVSAEYWNDKAYVRAAMARS